MRHVLELSKVMKRLVTAVMVFICGAAGYQFYLLMIAENWWPAATDIHPIGAGVLIVLASAAFGFILAPLFWWSIKKFGQFLDMFTTNCEEADYDCTNSLLRRLCGTGGTVVSKISFRESKF